MVGLLYTLVAGCAGDMNAPAQVDRRSISLLEGPILVVGRATTHPRDDISHAADSIIAEQTKSW